MRAMLFALAASLTLGLCACESTASGDSLAQAVEGREWSAEAIGGKDVVDGTKVTLKIDGGRISGKAGCNLYGGAVEINGERVKFGALFSTKMACMGGGVAEQESRYLSLLQGTLGGKVRGDGALVLVGRDGEIEFRAE